MKENATPTSEYDTDGGGATFPMTSHVTPLYLSDWRKSSTQWCIWFRFFEGLCNLASYIWTTSLISTEEEQEIWTDTDIDDDSNLKSESPPGSQHETPISVSSKVLVRLLLQAQFHMDDFFKHILLVLGRLYSPWNVISADFPTTLYLDKKSYKIPVCKN